MADADAIINAYPLDFDIFVTNQTRNKTGKEKILTFEVLGIGPAIAILLRRTLLNDTVAVAIEKVGVYFNNSVLSDETLAHRLALVPIATDKGQLEPFVDVMKPENTLVFKLDVKCTRRPGFTAEEAALMPNEEKYRNYLVTSADLQWVPQEGQAERFGAEGAKCLYGDIVIAKLRPEQAIMAEAFCHLGTGSNHAKFSNVSTAHFKLCSNQQNSETVQRCDSDRKKCQTKGDGEEHYFFEIESIGAEDPTALVLEALKSVRKRCSSFLGDLDKLNQKI